MIGFCFADRLEGEAKISDGLQQAYNTAEAFRMQLVSTLLNLIVNELLLKACVLNLVILLSVLAYKFMLVKVDLRQKQKVAAEKEGSPETDPGIVKRFTF